MSLSFLGYDEKVLTFEAASGLEAGDLVKISANGKVAEASTDGDVFCGKALNVRNGFAAVQLSGYMEAAYSGTVNLGYQSVSIDENGKVEVPESGGHEILVVTIDSTNHKIGFML